MNSKIYKDGDVVEVNGKYMCLACGETTYFKKGDKFLDCPNCEAGTENGPAGFEEGVAFWKITTF